MFHSLDRRFLYVAHKVCVTFDDGFGKEILKAGTGFFVSSQEQGHIFLFTNRHLIDPSFEDFEKRNWTIRRVMVTGFLPDKFEEFFCEINYKGMIYSQNSREDVAALSECRAASASWVGHKKITPQQVPLDMVANARDFEDLLLGDVLYFPGYPEWHDVSENRPIMRRGHLSSDPIKDYLGPDMKVSGRILAYEALSFAGSSGSPVFIPAFGVRLNDEHSGNYRPPKLIGINSGHLLTSDGHRHHSGISYLFKSAIIHEIVSR